MTDEQKALFLWKLGPGDVNKLLMGQNPIPEKHVRATADSWEIKPMPEKTGFLSLNVRIGDGEMDRLLMGHIPEVQEDHWFIWCDDTTIHVHRSWTGECVFEGTYENREDGKYLTGIRVNICTESIPGMAPCAAAALYLSLVAAEVGYDWEYYWDRFIEATEKGE